MSKLTRKEGDWIIETFTEGWFWRSVIIYIIVVVIYTVLKEIAWLLNLAAVIATIVVMVKKYKNKIYVQNWGWKFLFPSVYLATEYVI